LADAVGTGLVSIGSHTHAHLLADRTPAAELAADLDRSIGLIEDHLGVHPVHFAYPKALPAPAGSPAAAEVAARFVTAAVAGGRRNRYGRTDKQHLARTPITVGDGVDGFARKVEGGLRLEGWAREQLDRRRYAGATR
ncbi:MAG: polysaccharide deacetylase family protein, partial [Dermatophilaceae bacterium]